MLGQILSMESALIRSEDTLILVFRQRTGLGLGQIHVLKHGYSRSRVTLKASHFTFGFTSVTRQNRQFFLRFGGAGY